MVRGLMSDEEWAFSGPFVVRSSGRSGRPPADHRRMLDRVFWMARTGAARRDLHERFGKRSSVCRQFRRRTLAGVWDAMLEALGTIDTLPDSVAMIDSMSVRAHQHSAGAKGGFARGYRAVLAGGRTTKVHMATNGLGLPIAIELTGGEASDDRGFDRPLPRVLIADHIREAVEATGGLASGAWWQELWPHRIAGSPIGEMAANA